MKPAAAAMPAEARPRVRKLPSGKWQLLQHAAGNYASGGSHDSKTDAFNHYNENVRPDLEVDRRRAATSPCRSWPTRSSNVTRP